MSRIKLKLLELQELNLKAYKIKIKNLDKYKKVDKILQYQGLLFEQNLSADIIKIYQLSILVQIKSENLLAENTIV